jgi:hypothetical protein
MLTPVMIWGAAGKIKEKPPLSPLLSLHQPVLCSKLAENRWRYSIYDIPRNKNLYSG